MLHKVDCFDELAAAVNSTIPQANVTIHREGKGKIICEISALNAFKGLSDGMVIAVDNGMVTTYLEENLVPIERTIESRFVGTHGTRRRIAEVVNALSGYELL